MNLFIEIRVKSDKLNDSGPGMLEALCPVDIFEARAGKLLVKQEREDECVLCELCLQKAPKGAITIRKLYKDEVLISYGTERVQEPN